MEPSGAAVEGVTIGLIWAAFVLGLRHGIDWDHIAAITDITGSQTSPRRSIFLSTLYALGHALVVLILGILAVLAGDLVPGSLDAAMERVVGVTLLALGVYVVYSLVRFSPGRPIRSRWMLLIGAVRHLVRTYRTPSEIVEIEHEHEHSHDDRSGHSHEHPLLSPSPSPGYGHTVTTAVRTQTHTHKHVHRLTVPADPFTRYGRASSFGIGMLHGIGAETPSQILLFVTAVGTGGSLAGIALLVAFLVGLVLTNTAVAIASAYGFGLSRSRGIYLAVGITTAALSLTLGTLYAFGWGDVLPALL